MRARFGILLAAALAGSAAVCQTTRDKEKGEPETIHLTSSAFTEGQPIPTRHALESGNVSPELQWTNAPAGAKSLALICEDPDAPRGIWVHWVVYDLPPGAGELREGQPASRELSNGARQGVNDFGRIGYGGPAPPPGRAHRYFFRLYALDRKLEAKPGLSRKQLLAAMEGHVLGEGQLMGTFEAQ